MRNILNKLPDSYFYPEETNITSPTQSVHKSAPDYASLEFLIKNADLYRQIMNKHKAALGVISDRAPCATNNENCRTFLNNISPDNNRQNHLFDKDNTKIEWEDPIAAPYKDKMKKGDEQAIQNMQMNRKLAKSANDDFYKRIDAKKQKALARREAKANENNSSSSSSSSSSSNNNNNNPMQTLMSNIILNNKRRQEEVNTAFDRVYGTNPSSSSSSSSTMPIYSSSSGMTSASLSNHNPSSYNRPDTIPLSPTDQSTNSTFAPSSFSLNTPIVTPWDQFSSSSDNYSNPSSSSSSSSSFGPRLSFAAIREEKKKKNSSKRGRRD